jgi:electron transfer flavoprotein alpha subunit
MAGNVWVLAETWRGQVSESTFELLALGRELAAALGAPLQAVLLGHGVKPLAAELGAAESVLLADDPALAEPALEPYTQALTELVKARQPRCLLVPLTNVSWEVLGSLPAALALPCMNFCRDVRAADGRLQARCLLYGGKVEATAAVTATPAILGILPGARPAEKGRGERAPAVEEARVELAEPARVKFKKYLEPEAGDIDITQQTVLVSVGRGIQSQDKVALAEELAAALGGAVSGSRPVIDQGWLPLSRQVGKSGKQVKPKLYLALGISGAPEHQEGMRNSELIVAVNTDPGAPIFAIAHFGVCADLFDVVPALTDEIKRRKASRAA